MRITITPVGEAEGNSGIVSWLYFPSVEIIAARRPSEVTIDRASHFQAQSK